MQKQPASTWLAASTLLWLSMGCSSSNGNYKKPMDGAQNKEWVSLFDGKSINQWHGFNTDTVPAAWQVQDGAIMFNAGFAKSQKQKTGGDLITNEVFDDFHLQLEWKISPKGNSGIIFFIQEDKKYTYPWLTGPEMQVLDNDGHPDGKIHKHRSGDLYDLIACSRETVKTVGQWNQVDIIFEKSQLTFKLNGETVVTTTVGDDAWNKMVAGSKFKDQAYFAKNTRGRIGLQDHGDDVWFRNIRIKRL